METMFKFSFTDGNDGKTKYLSIFDRSEVSAREKVEPFLIGKYKATNILCNKIGLGDNVKSIEKYGRSN